VAGAPSLALAPFTPAGLPARPYHRAAGRGARDAGSVPGLWRAAGRGASCLRLHNIRLRKLAEVTGQAPDFAAAEKEYLRMTRQERSTQMAVVQNWLAESLAYRRNCLAYRKRTAIIVEVVRELECAGHSPAAHDACNTGVLTLE
jgi:hypothetical protein